MDDLIVIIITILFAVVGVLSQRKKKREAAAGTPQNQPGQPADFWEMIMGENRVVEQPYEEPIVFDDEPEEEVVVEKRPEFQPSYTFKAEREGSSDIEELEIEAKDFPKKKVLIDGEEFSLRKAVIYSEIMNRKYT